MAEIKWQTVEERAQEMERLASEALKDERAMEALQTVVALIKQNHNGMIDIIKAAFPLMPTIQKELEKYKIP